MKKLYLLLIPFIPFLTTFAQIGSISGSILDKNSNMPIPYSIVKLLQQDSTLVAGTLTDSIGGFKFQKIASNNYLLAVEPFGYEPQTATINTKSNRNLLLDPISLIPSAKQLQTVEIQAEGNVTYKVDKTVYLIDSSFLKNANSALDVAKHIPEIKVNDISGTLSLMQGGNCLVLINGVHKEGEPVNVKTINPNDVAKIEVITNPASDIGSQYDGVINIILKEKLNTGVSVLADCGVDLLLRNVDPYFVFGYTKDKVRINIVSHAGFNHLDYVEKIFRITDTAELHQLSERTKPRFTFQELLSATVDYYISPKDFLHFSSTNSFGFANTKADVFNTRRTGIYLMPTVDTLDYHPYLKWNSVNTVNTLFYKRKLKKEGQEFTANFNYDFTKQSYDRRYEGTLRFDTIVDTLDDKRRQLGKRNAFSLKLDYVQPFTKTISLTVGVLGFYQQFDNEFIWDNDVQESVTRDARFHAYTDLRFAIKKVNFRVGYKLENYNAVEDTNRIHQWRHLPSFTMLYRFKKVNSIRINYRSIANYPSIWNVTPIVSSNDYYTFTKGNPNLVPEQLHKFDFTYSLAMKKINYNAQLYVSFWQNNIVNFYDLYQNCILFGEYQNVKGKQRFGNLNTLTLQFFDQKWVIKASLDLFAENWNSRWNYSLDAGLETEVSFPLDFTLIGSVGVKGKQMLYQGFVKPRLASSDITYVALLKSFMKGKIQLMLAYVYFPKTHVVLELPNGTVESISHISQHLVKLRFTFFFNKGLDTQVQKIENQIKKEAKSE